MAEKSLIMTFINEEGKKASIRLEEISETVTEQEVSQAMDTLIGANIFDTTGGNIKSKDSAQIVSKDTQVLNIK